MDAGDIIAQREIPITEKTTAISLLRAQNKAAVEAFEAFLPDLLTGKCSRRPQKGPHHKLHYSWERPNDGVLDLDWDGMKISAFLRSMDYGILKIMGEPEVMIDGKRYTWKKYFVNYEMPAGMLRGYRMG